METKGSVPVNQVLRNAMRNKIKLHGDGYVLNVLHAENVPQA